MFFGAHDDDEYSPLTSEIGCMKNSNSRMIVSQNVKMITVKWVTKGEKLCICLIYRTKRGVGQWRFNRLVVMVNDPPGVGQSGGLQSHQSFSEYTVPNM